MGLEQKTQQFVETRKKFMDEGRPFVSLDETGFGRHGKVVYGYAPKGVPLVCSKKQLVSSRHTSVVAVMNSERIVSQKAIHGAFRASDFATFLEALDLPSKTIILLDNASIHRSLLVKQVAQTKGFTLLYLPPYSPWFNPIEEAFSIIKRHYYQHWDIEAAFQALKPHHCQAFFKSAFKKSKGI